MEFPEEILEIIRAYSRPLFQYYMEYRRMLKAVGLKAWPTLKKALEEYPSKIIPFIHSFGIAFQDRVDHMNLMKEYYVPKRDDLIEYDLFVRRSRGLKQQLIRKQYRERNKFHVLTFILYGETKEMLEVRYLESRNLEVQKE
jgi:hypothetical protein